MSTESSPPVHPWARAAFVLGVAALVGPAVACMGVWALNVGHDYDVIAIGATVVMTLAAALFTGIGAIIRMRRTAAPVRGAWQIALGFLSVLAAIGVWVVGGIELLCIMSRVMGHD